jgi:hypothetical protein
MNEGIIVFGFEIFVLHSSYGLWRSSHRLGGAHDFSNDSGFSRTHPDCQTGFHVLISYLINENYKKNEVIFKLNEKKNKWKHSLNDSQPRTSVCTLATSTAWLIAW